MGFSLGFPGDVWNKQHPCALLPQWALTHRWFYFGQGRGSLMLLLSPILWPWPGMLARSSLVRWGLHLVPCPGSHLHFSSWKPRKVAFPCFSMVFTPFLAVASFVKPKQSCSAAASVEHVLLFATLLFATHPWLQKVGPDTVW